jgi:hypothetical protein
MNSNAVKKPVVRVTKINEYLALKESIAALKRRTETLVKLADQAEEIIVSKLDFGADFSASGFLLSVRQTEKRFPAWKEHFIEACGKQDADRVLESTEAKLYRDLVIKKAA